MNHVYRLVWSACHGAFVPVAENLPAAGKRGSRARRLLASVLLASGTATALAQVPAPTVSAQALPQGGQVVSGTASIAQSGSHMDIRQTSSQAILNWQQFNIGSGASVEFRQPGASSVALNRVTGGDASQILGRLTANGQVFLVNPNGVLFGAQAQVDVSALVASTMSLANDDFLAGRYRFTRDGATAGIVNEGRLASTEGGSITLLAPSVLNTGTVSAQRGTVALAGGETVVLSLGSGAVSMKVDPALIQTLIENRQLVQAEGGQILMTAAAVNALTDSSINNSGTIRASSLVAQGGDIHLQAGYVLNTGRIEADGTLGGQVAIAAEQHDAFGQISASGSQGAGGTVNLDTQRTVMLRDASIRADGAGDGGHINLNGGASGNGGAYLSGTLSADGAQGHGGEVRVSGRELDLFGAHIAASGGKGGGRVLVGGGLQGQDASMANAETVNANAVQIDVSAVGSGAGGQAVLWSQVQTLFAGEIDARGASGGAKSTATGGLVEVSSHGTLGFGGQVQAGRLLLDPSSLNIIEPGMGFEITNFVDPDAASSGFGQVVYDVTNRNLLVLSPNQNQIGAGAGYVYQRDGTLVSALRDTGQTANWHVLGNDRYLVANQGAAGGAGAVAYVDAGSPPASGRMSATNSLMGDIGYGKGFGLIKDLGGGYYGATVSTSGVGLDALTLQKGAWHFFHADGSGSNIATGTVGPTNSLVGSTAGTAGTPVSASNWTAATKGDALGYYSENQLASVTIGSDQFPYVTSTFRSLGNGNWIMGSPQWNQGAGAITFVNPAMIDSGVLRGPLSASNSVLGGGGGTALGLMLREDGRAGTGLLQFGGPSSTNYVLNLPGYGGTGALVAIDATVAATGIVGSFNTNNALLLGGSDASSITQLSSGDLVLADSNWNGGKGYVRSVPFNVDFATTLHGSLAAVSASNSLVGSTADNVNLNQAGSRVGSSIMDLGNGSFIAYSGQGVNGNNYGAATYEAAGGFLPGVLSASNSVMGVDGARITPDTITGLSDGSYLIQGAYGGRFNVAGSGALAYGASGTRITGTLGATVGAWDGNYSGLQQRVDITDLGHGYWLANLSGGLSNQNGSATAAYTPAILWGGPTVARSGQLQYADTMTGVSATASLGDGRFVAAVPSQGGNAGAVGVVDASSATIPSFNASNALVGANPGDAIGSGGFVSLANGRWLALSPSWNASAGAVTLLSPANAASRLQGTLGAGNSLVGANAGDQVATSLYVDGATGAAAHVPLVRLGSSDMMALLTPEFDGQKGAATFFSRSSGDLTGTLSSANSLVGRTAGDHVGLGAYLTPNPYVPGFYSVDPGTSTAPIIELANGKFALRSSQWLAQAGDSAAAGALTFIDSNAAPVHGTVSASNSLVGAQAGDRVGYDANASLFTALGSGKFLATHSELNGRLGAVTLLDTAASLPTGVVSAANSLVNAGATTGIFDSGNTSLVNLPGGKALMTPEWDNGKGAVTWIPGTTSSLTGTVSATTSLVGTTAGQKLGGTALQLASGPLLLGSPGWNGNRGAATLLANTGGLAATLHGTLAVDGTNSFVGVDAGDRLASGGFIDLGNDIFVVQSPDVGSAANVRSVFGAVTLGDSVTNALRGEINSTNSFFSSVQGQAAAPYVSAQGGTGAILSTGSEVGVVSVVQPVSLVGSGLAFSDYSTRSVNMRPRTIEAVLDTGTDVTLQATQNINLLSPITVDNPNGNGGHLTLQTSSASGTVMIGNQGRVTTDNGELTIIAAGSFVNNASATPFNTGTDRWTVYANDPATSSLGNNLGFDFKEYGKSVGQTLDGRTALGANTNAVVFAVQPTLSVPTPSDSKTYDGTTALSTPFAISGLVGGDLVDASAHYTDAHVAVDPNNPFWPAMKDIVVTVGGGGVHSSVATGSKPVFGYANQNQITPGTTTYTGAGQIFPFQFDADLDQNITVSKVYDGSELAPANWVPSFIKNSRVRVWNGSNWVTTPFPDQFQITLDTQNVNGNGAQSATYIDGNWNSTSNVRDATQVMVPFFGGAYVLSGFSGGGLASDYQFQGINNYNTAPAQITPKPIMGGLTVANKVYDGNTSASVSGTPSLSGVLSGTYNAAGGAAPDDVQITGAAQVGAASFADTHAGTGKTVTVQLSGLSLSGLDASNYTIASATATADITPRPLSVSGSTVVGKQYDGTVAATVTPGTLGSVSGNANSGLVSGEALVLTASGTFASANVGTQNVTATYTLHNGTGGLASDYVVDGASSPQTLTGTISPAYLAFITGGLVGSVSKVYDGTSAATLTAANYQLTGWVNGDGGDVTVTKTSGSFAGVGAGNSLLVTVSLGRSDYQASSTNLSNYGLPTSLTGNVGQITPKPVTAGYTASNKVYDASTAAAVVGSSSDLVSGDVVSFSQSASFVDKDVGTGKTVNVSGIALSGADAGNYALQNTSASATANITAKPVTAGYTATNKVYDASTTASVSGSSADLVSGDVVSFTQSASFVDKNVGTGKTVNVSGIALGGADAGNYALQNTSASATANITAKPVTAGYTATNKVYDASAAAAVSASSADLVSGDVVSFSQSASFSDKNVGTGKTVNVSGIALSGADAGNYALQNTSANATANITAKPVTAGYTASDKVYDASTAAVVSAASADLVSGDVVSFTQSAAFSDKNVGTGKTVNVSGIALSGADAGNYALQNTSANATANITPAVLAVSGAVASNKAYDASTAATVTGGTITPLGSDSVTLSAAQASFADKNVGTGKTVGTAYALSGSDAGNYTLVQPSGLAADITPKALTVGYTASNKVYDAGTAASVSASSNDVVSGDVVSFSQSAGFVDKNVGSGKTVNITGIVLGGADAGNYALQSASASATADITARALSITGVTAANKVYDGASTASVTGTAGLSGVLSGDAVTVSGVAIGQFADKNVGTGKAIVVSGLSLAGTDAANYVVGALSATADITAKPVTAGYTASNKVYDASTAAAVSASSADLVSGDVVSFSQSASFSDKNVGTGKTVNVSGIALGGADAGNYALQNTSASATASITAKPVTAGYTASNKVYDASTAAAVSGSSADLVSGDVVSFSQSASFSDKNVGTGKTVNVNGIALGGTDAGNYALQNTSASATANITPATLAVGGTVASNKVYDGASAAIVTGGTITALGSDSVTLSAAQASFTDKNVGAGKTVSTSYVLSGTDAGNYVVVQPSGLVADIAPKALTAGYTSSNKVYDAGTAASVSASSSDLVSGDVVSFSQSASFADKNIGTGKTVNITGITLGGADSSNYALQNTSVSATANITPATLAVSGAVASNKVYEGTTAATVSGGAVTALGSDSVTLSAAQASFANKNVGTGKTVSTSYVLSGTDAGNYVVVQPSGLVADITPKALTVGYTASSKVYDAGTSASVSAGSSDVVSGDAVSFSQSARFSDKNVGMGKTVNVNGIALSGADAGNYALQSASASATADITPKPLTVGYTATSKVYDASTAATVSGSSADQMPGDMLSFSQSASFVDKNVGTGKAVNVSGIALSGADAGNYALQNTSASTAADITPKTVTASYAVTNKVYDASTAATISGSSADVVVGDAVNFSQSASFADKNVGTGKTVNVTGIVMNGADAGNYVLQSASTSAMANITPATLAVNGALAVGKVYDGSSAATVTGGAITALGSDSVTLSAAQASFADKNAGTGKAVSTNYVLSGTDAGNYTLVQPSGLAADIAPKAMTVGYTAANKVYDATTAASVNASTVDLVPGDTVSFSQGASFADKNVGTGKTVNITGITLYGADAGNYVLANPVAVASASISPAALLVTGANASPTVYDGTTRGDVHGGTVSPLGSDSVTLSDANATYADKQAGAGKGLTTAYVLSGLDAGNYTLVQPTALSTSVLPRVVQLTFTAVNKTFDGSASAQVVASISNLAVGDQVGVAQTAAFHDGRVGAGKVIDITQVQLAGVDAGNYALPATTWTTTGDIVVNGNTQGAGNAAGALQQSTASSGGSTPQAGGIPSAGVVVAGSASQSAAPLLSALMTGSPAYTTNTGGTVSSVLASGGTPVSGVYQNATGAATAGQTGTGAGNAALSSTGEPTPPTASGGDPVVGDANLGAMGSTSTRTGGGAVASSSMMTHAVGIANIATGAETGFTAFKPLGVLTVVAGQSASLLVGTDIFSHAGKPSTWRLVARQENGAPLPEWIRFDAQAGTFEVHAPEGLEVEVKVVVTAYDSQGNSATTGLTVKTGR